MKPAILAAMIVLLTACASDQTAVVDPVEEDNGIPDLTVQAFIPPVIMAGSGATIYLSDLVANIGEGRSGESTVQYYISNEPDIDVSTAKVIGERTLRSLGPNEVDESMELPFVIPAGLDHPPLFLAACVDVDDTLLESNDGNNCTTANSDENSMYMSPAIFDGVGVVPAN